MALRLNGSKPIRIKPHLKKGKTGRRVRRALADSVARQSVMPSANSVRIKVGHDWDGRGHSEHMRLPDEVLPHLPDTHAGEAVLRPLPRRKQAKAPIAEDYVQMQMTLPAAPRVGLLRTLRRLLVWLMAFASFQSGTLWDRLHGEDSIERRAIRLRQTFERIGGTFVKIGQQMSSRLDVLPVQYCQELANMLDNYPPFPTEQAVEIIERSTGKKLEAIFSAFDPQPIGSASIACVYQAVLRESGEKVAVKVRRPGIRALFEQDFRVIDFLTMLLETLTIVRPGFTHNLRMEIRDTLSSELDFRREARLCELFERRARKHKKAYFGAPRIHFAYSNDEVLVQQFVSGMWLWEILAAIEHRDPAGLRRMRELNIDPKVVARRLIYAHDWSIFAHLAFHADPHPANIVVQANNKLIFVDFGACGYINSVRRAIYQRVYESFINEDPYAMAQCSLAMLEPLPPMDINAITKDVEMAYHTQLLAMKSKHAPWYERTTASLLITSINVTGRYQLPVPRDYLMFTRATLLYDTMSARLDPTFNAYDEYKHFRRLAQKKAKKEALRGLRRRLRTGLTGGDYMALAQAGKTWNDFMFRAQRLLTTPYDFAIVPYTIEKWTFTLMTAIRFGMRTALFTLVCAGLAAGLMALRGEGVELARVGATVVGQAWYWAIVALLGVMHMRLIFFRLGDKTRNE
ncbi:MAG: AarF/ABC1/UbiB kinase family protein [Chloroflexi bacterium]|nr:AarF/ABC1/UbiB kinase family protein [Chloroflexota bacterium]